MPQGIDDFTIVLPELIDMATCGLEMYDGLDRLWRMIERYKMAACWHLEDVTPAMGSPLGGEVELPLTLNSQDAKGNILKLRLHFKVGGTTKGHGRT